MKANRVLIPLDDSEFGLNVLPHVTRLLEPENTELFLVHVEPAPAAVMVDEHVVVYADQAAASMQAEGMAAIRPYARSLQELGFRVKPVVTFGDPVSEIQRIVEESGIDLIAMATHGRTGFSRLLRGSIAQTVLQSVEVPVLLYRVYSDDADESVLRN